MSDPRNNAGPIRTSRELSGRVEQDFHRRGDPFRRLIRGLSLAACAAVVAWVGLAAATGRRTIYEAGPVTEPHQFFENNCTACHTAWAPAARFRFVMGDLRPVHSIDDAKCQECHAGSAHYDGQMPAHEGLSCAACHREHRSVESLELAGNAQCAACHGAPQAHVAASSLSAEPVDSDRPERMLAAITSFADDHPEFAALAQRDGARLAFNHSVHLRHEYDDGGTLVKGIQNERGELEDLSQDCTACHQVDAQRRNMLPIRYADHCRRCHPLFFDNENFLGEAAPHGVDAATLRGFLVERYTELALGDVSTVEPQTPPRALPGRPVSAGALTADQRRRVNENAAAADERLIAPAPEPEPAAEDAARKSAVRQGQLVFGHQTSGGCRLCHEVGAIEPSDDPRGFLSAWEVAPTNIPRQWMARSRFNHDSHRFVACTSCHRDANYDPPREVTESTTTSDVLLPGIAVCRKCHGNEANVFLRDGAALSGPGAASRCVDCHDYHHRDGESTSGGVLFDLPTQSEKAEDGS